MLQQSEVQVSSELIGVLQQAEVQVLAMDVLELFHIHENCTLYPKSLHLVVLCVS